MNKVFGISSMICGILSALLIIMPYFGIPLGVMAIVLFAISKKKEHTGMAVTGLITGIIGIALGIMMCLLMVVALSLGMV